MHVSFEGLRGAAGELREGGREGGRRTNQSTYAYVPLKGRMMDEGRNKKEEGMDSSRSVLGRTMMMGVSECCQNRGKRISGGHG